MVFMLEKEGSYIKIVGGNGIPQKEIFISFQLS